METEGDAGPSAPLNPITQRLALLEAQWTSFTENADARLLRWVCAADEVAMVEAFVAKESEPEACSTPDMFIRLDDPFVEPAAHGFTLRSSFLATYEEARPLLEKEGLDASFVAPDAAKDDDVSAFVKLMQAYHAHQQGQMAHLALFLNPSSVRDGAAYQEWLGRVAAALSEELRVVLMDFAAAPGLAGLAEREPTLVMSTVCNLDMPSAFEELSLNAGIDTPGGQFRHLFVQLGNKAKQGDVEGATALANQAGALAVMMQWPHLAAGIQMLLAGVHVGAGKHEEALASYAEVDRLGLQTYAIGLATLPSAAAAAGAAPPEPSADAAAEGPLDLQGAAGMGYGLRLQRNARLGEGTVLIAQSKWQPASKTFLAAATLSQALDDARGELDGHRLASFCQEQDKKLDPAWQHGLNGLDVAERMDDETRQSSTLAYLGEAMLRIARAQKRRIEGDKIDKRMKTYLGPDWQKSAQQGSATS